MSKSKKARRARYIIAIDQPHGCYLRRTLNVTHHLESGEAQYDTKPVRPSQAPLRIRQAYHRLRKELFGK
jgi:hypothetical protein